MPNYEYYKIFCKIAACGSISKAASQLYVSQPAVSLSIKQLEKELGVKLFIRSQRGVQLTVEGNLLYNYARQGCFAFAAGEEKLREVQGLQAGEVRIGASDMTLKYYLLPYLEIFRKKFPNVKIKVTNAPTPNTLKSLREGLIDFGIVSDPFPWDSDITSKPVKEICDVLIASAEVYGSMAGESYHLSSLTDMPYIMIEGKTSSRLVIDKYLSDCGVEIRPEIELATSDLILEFAKKGMGLAFIMEDFAKEAIAAGELIKIKLTPEMPARNFNIVTMANVLQHSAAIKLLQMLELPSEK